MSSTYKEIISFIEMLPQGEIFSVKDLTIKKAPTLLYNALSRLTKESKIERLSRGKYFIPRKSKFGHIKPSDDKIIKYVIEEIYKRTKNKPYFASNSIFQKLGLTTQITSEIFLICSIKVPYNITIKNLKFNLIRYKGNWKNKNVKYYEILYSIQNMDKVPDAIIDDVYFKLFAIISKLTTKEISILVECSNDFNNKTKVLLGSILSLLNYNAPTKMLKIKIKNNYQLRIHFEKKTIPEEIKKYWRIYEPTSK